MSIVPGSVTANLAPYVSLPVVANSQIIPNMAYMGGSSAAMPYMFHHQTTQMPTNQGTPTNGNSAVNLIGMTGLLSQKDSRWLQLEVCREFQRNKCSRCDTECKFAHPASNVEVQSGRVTACYDSIKGRCNRDKPACKYFHPPQHLKDQLLINGRNHLALKNAIMQQMGYIQQPIIHPPVSTMASPFVNSSIPPLSVYSQALIPPTYIPSNQMVHIMAQSQEQAAVAAAAASVVASQQASSGPQQPNSITARPSAVHLIQTSSNQPIMISQQNSLASQNNFRQRTDKLEVCREFQRGTCTRNDNECRYAHPAESVTVAEDGSVTVCMDFEKGRCSREPCRYFHRPENLRSGSAGVPVTSPNSSPGTVTTQSCQQQLHLNPNHTQNHIQQQQQQQQQAQQQAQQQSQQSQVMPTSALCNPTTSMADVQATLHNSAPTSVMTIPTNVGHFKTPTIGLLDKQSNLPVYRSVTLAANDALAHAHTIGANPATVQAHHPSVYHPAMIHPLQQPHQAPPQQTFLGPSCELMPVPAYYNNVQYY